MLRHILGELLNFLLPKHASSRMIENMPLDVLLATITPQTVSGPERFFLPYRNPLTRALIHQLKYRNDAHAAMLCADLFLHEMMEELSEIMEWRGHKKFLLVPIPMSRERLRERGYNQTELLAQTILARGGAQFFDLDLSLLVRTIERPTQTSIKDKDQRLKNIKGIFSVKNKDSVRGRHAVLLDDVTTTGATLREAKEILMKAGAADVLNIAIAH